MTHRPPALSSFARVRVCRAVSVRQLAEWAFAREHARLDLPDRRAPEDRGFGFGMEYVLIERARVGCQIDGGRGGAEVPVHWDAETLAARLACLPKPLGGVPVALAVAHFARALSAPDWMPGARPRLVPALVIQNQHGTSVGTEIVRITEALVRGRKVRQDWRACPVRWDPHPDQIAQARKAWAEWRAALEWLRDDLRAQDLRDHRLVDDLPPKEPWRE
jgi:hypothetical protein